MATAGSGSDGAQPRLERFDGSDPSLYKRWRRRAALSLISLPSTYGASKLGPKLMEYLGGEAELAVEHLKIDDLAKEGGEKKIFEVLDERYMPLEKDDMNEALKEFFFEVQIKPGEAMKSFITRLATSHRKLAEQGVSLPKEVQGWFLMKKMRLDSNQEAMILTTTGGSYDVNEVNKAVRAVLANVKGSTKPKETFVTDSRAYDGTPELSDDEEVIQVLAADVQSKENYSDEEVVEVFETYKQVRAKMQEFKKTRGYRPLGAGGNTGSQEPWKLRGTISAKIEQIKSRARCHKCGKYGHWKKECKANSSGTGARADPGPSKEVHIVDPEETLDEDSYLQLFQEVDEEIYEGEVMISERVEPGGVMLDSNDEHSKDEDMRKALSQQSGQPWSVVGDINDRTISCTDLATFEMDILSSESQGGSDSKAEGQYMADLSDHGVPDTACRRSLIGASVLERMEEHVRGVGCRIVRKKGVNVFRFGNAESLTSTELAIIPCFIGGRKILLQVAVLPGTGSETPLLMSKELLRELGAVLDMTTDTMMFRNLKDVTVQLGRTNKGHYAVPLFQCKKNHEVHATTRAHTQHSGSEPDASHRSSDSSEVSYDGFPSVESRQQELAQPDGVWTPASDRGSNSQHAANGCGGGLHGRLTTKSRSTRRHHDDRREIQGNDSSERTDDARHIHGREELCAVGEESHHWNKWADDEEVETLHRAQGSGENAAPEQHGESPNGLDRTTVDRLEQSVNPSACNPKEACATGGYAPSIPNAAVADLGNQQHPGKEEPSRRRHGDRQSRGGGQVEGHDRNDGAQPTSSNRSSTWTDGVNDGGGDQSGSGRSFDDEDCSCGHATLSGRGSAQCVSSVNGADMVHGSAEALKGSDILEELPAECGMNRKTRRRVRKAVDNLVDDLNLHGCFETWLAKEKEMNPKIMEVFSVPRVNEHHSMGQGKIQKGSNFDLELGDDLLRAEHREHVRRKLDEESPFLVIVSPPCRMFSTRRRPTGDLENERKLMKEAICLLNFAVEVCKYQHQKGRFFLFEHPSRAKSWDSRRMTELAQLHGVDEAVFDMCEYGMVDRISGLPHKKETRLLGNFETDIMKGFVRKCSGNHDHQVLEGKVKLGSEWINRTRLAQEYPLDFCGKIIELAEEQYRRSREGKQSKCMETFAVDSLVGDDLKKIEDGVRKAHLNLGHPSTERFVEMLRAAGASENAIMIARKHKCSVCEAQAGPKLQKVSKMRKTYEFNVGIVCDLFELELSEKQKVHCLSVVCEGTNFHVVVPLWKGKTADETRKAYRKSWKNPLGSPIRLFTDGGPEFQGSFQEGLMLDGTADERTAAFAPWQNGIAERHGQTWKSMFYKTMKGFSPQTHDDFEEIMDQVTLAKNTMLNRSGFSPYQRVYGKQPRIPGMIYDHGPNVVVNSGYLAGDPSYVKSVQIRHEARKAFCEADHEDRVRKAIEHRSRPERGPFYAGCKVFVWRPGGLKPSGDRAFYWRGPGTVIGNTDSSKYWVSFGSKVLKCAPEQLRRLTTQDEAAVKLVPEELVDWSFQSKSSKGVATFHDISEEAKPVDVLQKLDQQDYWEYTGGERMVRVHVTPRNQKYVPTVADMPPIAIEYLLGHRKTTMHFTTGGPERVEFDDWKTADDSQTVTDQQWTGRTAFVVDRTRRMDVEDMEFERNVRPRMTAETGEDDGMTQEDQTGQEPTMPSDASDLTVTPTTPPADGSIEIPSDLEEFRDVLAPETMQQGNPNYGPIRMTGLTRALRNDINALDGHPLRPASSTRNAEALMTELAAGQWLDKKKHWKINWQNKTLTRNHDWRRKKFEPSERECPVPVDWLTGVRYTLVRTEAEDAFEVYEDDFHEKHEETLGKWWSGYTVLEFDNLLALEQLDEGEFEVNEATLSETRHNTDEWSGKQTEMQKLQKYDAVEVISPKEAERIRNTTTRILPSRFVITKKPDERNPGHYITKARWCIRGYLDPDVNKLQTQSPTLSTEALALVMQLSASYGWDFGICDIEGAFLQGGALCREQGELFVELPPGGAPGIEKGSLLRIKKAVYGLIDAPREWYTALQQTMDEAKFRRSKLDTCLYYAWEKGRLVGALAIHVDDILFTGTAEFQNTYMQKLKDKYPFKHWKVNQGEFLGRYLQKNGDGSISVNQKEYCEKMKTIELSRERRREKNADLTEKERSQLRGVAGALNWITTATRPDMAAATASVQQKITSAKVGDIAQANQAVAEARDHKHVTIVIQPVQISDLALLVTADASWTSENDLKSQGAFMICATTKDVEKGHAVTVSPLKWKSQKQERAVSSTLAAELLTVSKGVAEATWMRHFFCEAMVENYDLTVDEEKVNSIPIIAVTDNKPLYDHIHADHGICQDKRLAIEILLLRRDVRKYNVILRWIDTAQMLVDCMTKTKVKPQLMRHVLATGKYAIMEENAMLEAKRAQRHTKKLIEME